MKSVKAWELTRSFVRNVMGEASFSAVIAGDWVRLHAISVLAMVRLVVEVATPGVRLHVLSAVATVWPGTENTATLAAAVAPKYARVATVSGLKTVLNAVAMDRNFAGIVGPREKWFALIAKGMAESVCFAAFAREKVNG